MFGSVHCTLWVIAVFGSVHCTLWVIAVFGSVHYTLWVIAVFGSVHCTLWGIAVFGSVHCTLWVIAVFGSVHCTLWVIAVFGSVHCTFVWHHSTVHLGSTGSVCVCQCAIYALLSDLILQVIWAGFVCTNSFLCSILMLYVETSGVHFFCLCIMYGNSF